MDKKLLIAALVVVIVVGAVMLMPKGKEPGVTPGPSPGPEPGPSPGPGPGPGPEPSANTDDSQATQEGVDAVVEANNQFAFDLYGRLKDNGGNVFFSPYSISTALAMTYEGARDQTADEMATVMHFPTDASVRGPAYARLYNLLNGPGKPYNLSTANALWAQYDYPFLSDYLDTVSKYYGGKATNLDFKTKTEESRVTINDWVAGQTNNRIQNLIPQGILTDMTRLVLTNAVYFKGKWTDPFLSTNTKEADFKVSPGSTVKAQMMTKRDGFKYAETGDLQVLELPYSGFNLSMLVLLPKGDGTSALEGMLTPQNLAGWTGSMQYEDVELYLPKFKFETKSYLAENLKAMGMPTAFSDSADFSGMDGTQELSIAEVIHQAFVEVNEEGTEAAAATAVVMVATAMQPSEPIEPIVFRADHPFVFLIRERTTGSILFLGKVSNPTQG